MTTENPMRMVETNGASKWLSSKDAATFASVLNSTAADELGLLLKEQRYHGDQRKTVPNRSGSAPPSMEGSFAAFGNLMSQQNSSLSPIMASLSNAIENCESEEQLRSDPAYFAYYCSNVNLNPRLPPPIISRENRHLARHIGGFGNNWRLTSYDDSGRGTSLLSTHNEETEDDRASLQALNDWEESSSPIMSAHNVASLAGRHKSLVDLIQEDFPRTPSPVYNQSHSSSHAATAEESTDHEVPAISLDDLSLNISEISEPESGSADAVVMRTQGASACGVTSSDDPQITSFPKRFSFDAMEKSLPGQKFVGNKGDLVSGVDSSRTRAPNTSSLLGAEDSRNKQPHLHAKRSSNYPVTGGQARVISQGVNYSRDEMEKVSHDYPKFSSVEVQPVLHPPGLTPPLYASPATYGNTFYPNLPSSGMYPPHHPQYSLGGYALGSSFLPPFMAGYASPNSVPMPLDSTGQGAISTGESSPHSGDSQHNKFYGHGLMMQPPFVDPLHMHYFQRQGGANYGALGHYGQVSPTGVIGSEKETAVHTLMGDPKFQPLSIPSPRMGGITGNYYRSPPSMGVMTQYPASPLGSPILPGSPMAGTNPLGRRNEMKFQQGSIRGVGVSGWQAQRGGDSFNDPKKHSFLEELRSNSSRKIDLSEIAGRIVEFSVDQHGSRFIQQKLENCSVEDKASVFKEVLPHASKLMTDVFGNYVIQKFFEHGSHDQRRELANQLSGQMLPLSLQMYGCRVIQKALEVIDLDQKTQLVHELDGNIIRCVRDQNGNHVIQKCIECLPTEKIGFIISSFRGQVATLSTHPYGCRVIQRVLEHCSDESQSQCIVDEILESAYVLAQDQYGNYVTQHVMERGKPQERSQIISKLTGKIVQMSQHKYASNVIEKCLEHGGDAERELMIEEILGQSEENDNLLVMMKDQFANYVVQKILEISSDDQRVVLLNRIRVHLQALKKYTYGKHIVARFEQLCSEDSEDLGLQAA